MDEFFGGAEQQQQALFIEKYVHFFHFALELFSLHLRCDITLPFLESYLQV